MTHLSLSRAAPRMPVPGWRCKRIYTRLAQESCDTATGHAVSWYIHSMRFLQCSTLCMKLRWMMLTCVQSQHWGMHKHDHAHLTCIQN